MPPKDTKPGCRINNSFITKKVLDAPPYAAGLRTVAKWLINVYLAITKEAPHIRLTPWF